jgi:RNA recognition motif-containing protein
MKANKKLTRAQKNAKRRAALEQEKLKKPVASTEKPKLPLRKPGFDLSENRTVFLRNLPYSTSQTDVEEALKLAYPTAGIEKIFLVKDSIGQCKGTAFIKMKTAEDVETVISGVQSESIETPITQNEFYLRQNKKQVSPVMPNPGAIRVAGREVFVMRAVSKEEVSERKSLNPEKEKRDILKQKQMELLNFNAIDENSDEFKKLAKWEQDQIKASRKERLYKLSDNTNFFVSDKRVSVRGLNPKITEKDLKQFVLAQLNDPELAIRVKIVTGDKGTRERSAGYGFIECPDYETGKKVILLLNRKSVLDAKHSLLCEFALEDKRKLRILEKARELRLQKIREERHRK